VTEFKSLADFLGVADPVTKELPSGAGPSPKLTIKDFCKEVLRSPQYRESLLRRIVMDELPPAVECMLWDRAHGKTADKLEVKDTTDPLEDLTIEQLEDRAMKLLEVARHLRTESSAPEEDRTETSVH
jgi:hypothetical protein